MAIRSLFSTALVALAGLATALPQIETYGNKFYDDSGNQFFIKGVAYQLRPSDPLIDTEQCQRDATLLKELGANTLRVYHVDPNSNHDGCMAAFEAAGIYLTIDLDTFPSFILPYNTYWNSTQFAMYSRTMDAFVKYNNTLGFYIGNEIIAKSDQSNAAPFIKAATRDMKAYRDSKGYRKVPIGYSATDIEELRPHLQDYLTCGGNSSETIDFYGVNAYEWCTPNTYAGSGYPKLQEMAEKFPVPIFFSETGCIAGPAPRAWEDQEAIFSEPMIDDWSGAIVYEWIQEQNNYGIISYGPGPVDPTITAGDVYDGFTRKGTPTPIQPQFDNLKSRWATITPKGTPRASYDASSVSTRACPTAQPGRWEVNGNVRLPTLDETFSGTFSPSPTVEPSAVDNVPNNASVDDNDASSGDRNIALSMSAALVMVTMIFTLWL